MSYIKWAMMSKSELAETLSALRLTQTEAAQLLGVASRTFRRWLEGEDIPGPAEAALRAWRSLQARNLAWRPDSISIVEDDQDQIARHRNHSVDLAALLARVEARGGARTPWVVNVAGHEAKLGPIEVGFYLLQSGGFSLSTYTRRDQAPDLTSDWALIEDAAACIARKLAQWKTCADALSVAATRIRALPPVYVSNGPRLMSATEKDRRTRRKMEIALEIARLAEAALVGEAEYPAFEKWNDELRSLGTSLEDAVVSEIARAFVAADRT